MAGAVDTAGGGHIFPEIYEYIGCNDIGIKVATCVSDAEFSTTLALILWYWHHFLQLELNIYGE